MNSISRILEGKPLMLLLIVVFNFSTLRGQEKAKEILPPSPNAAAFAKYGNIPVSPHTGVPNISIPIYEIKVRDINIPISLSYHASGIKVSEEAGRVGLGWVLNSGGVISRNIVGWDDFFQDPRGYVNPTRTAPTLLPLGPKYIPEGILQIGTIAKFLNTTPEGPAQVSEDLTSHVYGNDTDFEPDQFTYNILGQSGKFVLYREGQEIKALVEKAEKIKITPASDGSSWTVRTADGATYIFGAAESYRDAGPGASNQNSSWYLTEIISPQGEHVWFNYVSIPAEYIRPIGHFQEMFSAHQFSSQMVFSCTPIDPIRLPMPQRQYFNIYLASIKWSKGLMEFEMEGREDILGDNRVKSIKVKEEYAPLQYRVVREYSFGYGYFDHEVPGGTFSLSSDIPESYFRRRLKLISLTEKNTTPGLGHKHEFAYYETALGDKLPAKNSFARDHWGYYNGKTNNTTLIPTFKHVLEPANSEEISGMLAGVERNSSSDHVKAFSLREITYPTKGKTRFYYEPNDYEIVPDRQPEVHMVEGFISPVYSVSDFKGSPKDYPLDISDAYISPSGSPLSMPIEIAFVYNENPCSQTSNQSSIYVEFATESGTSISGTRMSLGGASACTDPNSINCFQCDPNQTSYGAKVYKGAVTLQPGKYLIRVFVPGDEVLLQTISVKYGWWADVQKRSPLGKSKKYNYGGGIRIQKIEDYEPVSNKLSNVRVFKYNYQSDADSDGSLEEHSYGKRMVQPDYSYFEVRWEKREQTGPNGTPLPPSFCYDCTYVLRHSDSYLPVSGSQGYAVGYSKVIEWLGENQENGRIEYEFENNSETVTSTIYQYQNASYELKPPVIATHPHPLNGMLTRKTEYAANNNPIHQVITVPDIKFKKTIYGLQNGRIQAVNFQSWDYNTPYGIFGNYSDVLLSIYPSVKSGFQFVSSSTETFYDKEGNATLTIASTNSYDNEEHLQVSKSTIEKNNNHKQSITYKYPRDYEDADADAAILAMKSDAQFIHNKPVEVITKDIDQNGEEKIVRHDITIFDAQSNFLPKEILNLETSSILSSVPAYVPSAGYDPNLYRQVFSFGYKNGNVSKVQKASDIPISYLWAYNNSLPIAEAKNAFPGEIFYNSFEEDGQFFTDAQGNNIAKTGEKVLASTTYQFDNNYLPDESKTFMTYWVWDDSKTEWVFSGIKPFQRTITIATGSKIDEVRAFPKNAQLTTYTYKPLVGISSQTDANNVTQYFEYDELGRLKFLRDENKDLVKIYEYHYAK